jgi:hypothetical protein
MPQKKPVKSTAVYSVKLEATDGAIKIFTLRVGKGFTEISYEKNGKFVEIVREEKGEIRHEKFI